jgi:hypothetical protein
LNIFVGFLLYDVFSPGVLMKNYSKSATSGRAALHAQAQEKGGHATIALPVFHQFMPDQDTGHPQTHGGTWRSWRALKSVPSVPVRNALTRLRRIV